MSVQAQSQPEAYKLEAYCGRDPELAEGGEPTAEILSVLSEGTRSFPAPDDRGRMARAFDLAGITNRVAMAHAAQLPKVQSSIANL